MTSATIKLPEKLVPVFAAPRGSVSYRALFSGRGAGKSYSAALMAAVWGYADKMKVLCVREFQASIKDSFHAELKFAIDSTPFLSAHYDVGVDYIKGANGTEFIFKGLPQRAIYKITGQDRSDHNRGSRGYTRKRLAGLGSYSFSAAEV